MVHVNLIAPYPHLHLVAAVVDGVAVGVGRLTAFIDGPDVVNGGSAEIVAEVLERLTPEHALWCIAFTVDRHLDEF